MKVVLILSRHIMTAILKAIQAFIREKKNNKDVHSELNLYFSDDDKSEEEETETETKDSVTKWVVCSGGS